VLHLLDGRAAPQGQAKSLGSRNKTPTVRPHGNSAALRLDLTP